MAHLTAVDLSLRFLLLNQIDAMRAAGCEVYGLAAPGPWREQLEAKGVKIIDVPHLRRGRHGVRDALAIWEIYRILRRERFDILHTHTPKAGLLGRIAARLARQRGVVHTIHGLASNEHSPLWLHGLVWCMERVGAALSDHVVLQNAEDLQTVRRLRMIPSERCSLLGNGVDLVRFSPSAVPPASAEQLRAELGIAQDAIVVGMVARLIWRKGYREFFECARRLRARLPQLVFVCAGGLEPSQADGVPAELLAELQASGSIVHLGVRTDIERVYAIMDIAVLPSYFPEGIPRALIEPAAMGKPLVAANNRGCRDVVRPGENGFLVPPRDGVALAQAIERLVLDPELRRDMGRASRRWAEQQFDERQMAARSLELYAELAGAPGRGA